jgi:hypothetical protein
MGNLTFKPASGGELILQEDGGSAALTVETDGTVTLANRILKQTQPGFFAYGDTTGSVDLADNAYVVCNNEATTPAFEHAGMYRTDTGKFTTPVAGVYIIGFHFYAYETATFQWVLTDGTDYYTRMLNACTSGNDYQFTIVLDLPISKTLGIQNVAGDARMLYFGYPYHTHFYAYLLG